MMHGVPSSKSFHGFNSRWLFFSSKKWIGTNPGGWHGVPRLSWSFAWFHRSSSEASRGEEWRGENPDIPVSYGNPSRRMNCRRARRILTWMSLACDIYLRVISLQLSLLNWHSLLNCCVIGSKYRHVCLEKPHLKIEDWKAGDAMSCLFLLTV